MNIYAKRRRYSMNSSKTLEYNNLNTISRSALENNISLTLYFFMINNK